MPLWSRYDSLPLSNTFEGLLFRGRTRSRPLLWYPDFQSHKSPLCLSTLPSTTLRTRLPHGATASVVTLALFLRRTSLLLRSDREDVLRNRFDPSLGRPSFTLLFFPYDRKRSKVGIISVLRFSPYLSQFLTLTKYGSSSSHGQRGLGESNRTSSPPSLPLLTAPGWTRPFRSPDLLLIPVTRLTNPPNTVV